MRNRNQRAGHEKCIVRNQYAGTSRRRDSIAGNFEPHESEGVSDIAVCINEPGRDGRGASEICEAVEQALCGGFRVEQRWAEAFAQTGSQGYVYPYGSDKMLSLSAEESVRYAGERKDTAG